MKKLFFVLFLVCCLFSVNNAHAEHAVSQTGAIVTPVNTLDFARSYKTSCENLFYLLLSALNENNYSIEEIQFKTGSVLFKAYTKEFIASIAAQDSKNSFIKIIPADNNYNFSPFLIQKLHKYIDANNTAIFKNVL